MRNNLYWAKLIIKHDIDNSLSLLITFQLLNFFFIYGQYSKWKLKSFPNSCPLFVKEKSQVHCYLILFHTRSASSRKSSSSKSSNRSSKHSKNITKMYAYDIQFFRHPMKNKQTNIRQQQQQKYHWAWSSWCYGLSRSLGK